MTLWDLRQLMEQAVPLSVYLAILAAAVVMGALLRRRP